MYFSYIFVNQVFFYWLISAPWWQPLPQLFNFASILSQHFRHFRCTQLIFCSHSSPVAQHSSLCHSFLRSFRQMFLFLATLLQFLSPNMLTSSSYLSLGLPLYRLPFSVTTILPVESCFSDGITCLAYLRQSILMYVSFFLNMLYNSVLNVVVLSILILRYNMFY